MMGADMKRKDMDAMAKVLMTMPMALAVAPRESAYTDRSELLMNCPRLNAIFVKKMLINELFHMVAGSERGMVSDGALLI
jgi:hypothetical protein